MCDPAQHDEPILFKEAVMRLQAYSAGIYANRAEDPGAVKQIWGACQKAPSWPIECVGATIGRPPTWRSDAFPGRLFHRQTGTGEQCSPLQEFFDSLCRAASAALLFCKCACLPACARMLRQRGNGRTEKRMEFSQRIKLFWGWNSPRRRRIMQIH